MKYLIIITLLLVSWLTKAQFTNTDNRTASTNPDLELLNAEFKFWQATNDSSKFNALLDKVKIYKHSSLYQESLTEADRAESYATSNKERAEIKYERMLSSFLSDDYNYCSILTFDSSEEEEIDFQQRKNVEFIRLCSLNESGNWLKCKTELVKHLDANDSIKKKEITALPENYKYKSADKSKHLSAMLPGLGEIYDGYPVKGITSFVLNAGFLAFGGYNFYADYYVTGCVSGLFPMLKFYGGGKRLSVNLADKHNQNEAYKIRQLYNGEIQALLK